MAYTRGEHSNSFLREQTLVDICITRAEDKKILTELFKRNNDFTLKYPKSVIKKTLTSIGIDGHMLFNAPNISEIRDFNELRQEIEDMKDYLANELGLRGVVEFHFGKDERGGFVDRTVNSSHVHFWGDKTQDTMTNRNLIANYLIDRGFTYPNIVHIQSFDAGKVIPEEELIDANEDVDIGKEIKNSTPEEEIYYYIEDELVLNLQKEMDDFLKKINQEVKSVMFEEESELEIEILSEFSKETELALSEIDIKINELKSFTLDDEDLVFRV